MGDEKGVGFLTGLRVIELADELGEYCSGKILAGLGAEVIKVEPPRGEPTRNYGPFLDDQPGVGRSLYFWHYNLGKRSVIADLDRPADQELVRALMSGADIVIESRSRGYLAARGLDLDDLRPRNPGLIMARITPFGDDGPWADYQASDLVHLALGGVMMNCGYDPDPDGVYDTPPVAPQMWQSYHIAGEMLAIGVLGALSERLGSGLGQRVSLAVHEAVSKQTESDLTNWIYSGVRHARQTGRHSFPYQFAIAQEMTKDGRWVMPYRTYLPLRRGGDEFERLVELLDRHGMAEDLTEDRYQDPDLRALPSTDQHVADVVARFVRRYLFSRDIWLEGQRAGLTWAPIRKPEENLADLHWQRRRTFTEVPHPDLGRSFWYVGSRWVAEGIPWQVGRRAPLPGEDTAALRVEPPRRPSVVGGAVGRTTPSRPPLAGVRIVDFGWILASAGAGRFLAAQGAEVIKIEHASRLDPARWRHGMVRDEEARAASAGRVTAGDARPKSPNRSGHFMDINAGKRAISLNVKDGRGKQLLARLIASSNAVAEGFSPGAMERMGFGYATLRSLRPDIVYVQQSGMGQAGTYGVMRSYGPTAQAFSGLTDMSGLPEPFPPAGIGYSYLDWFGAYNLALALSAGLYRQKLTGQGCWIDTSQVEAGIQLVGTAILDSSANGRIWHRYGNRSPYKLAAPQGAYPARGGDRWIALSCYDDRQWSALAETLRRPALTADPRFATLEQRLAHQDALDAVVAEATRFFDAYELMASLQKAGIAAGVCQTAEDRCEHDPQLRHLQWLRPLPQTEIGTWPVRDLPFSFSETPAHVGGTLERHGPSYGEDNEYVYGTVLGLSGLEIARLEAEGVI